MVKIGLTTFSPPTNAYVPLKIQDVPKYISTYTSITSEDPSLAIAGAILNKGTPNTHSPLEKIVID